MGKSILSITLWPITNMSTAHVCSRYRIDFLKESKLISKMDTSFSDGDTLWFGVDVDNSCGTERLGDTKLRSWIAGAVTWQSEFLQAQVRADH